MEPGSNGRDVVSHPVERAWEIRRQHFLLASRLRWKTAGLAYLTCKFAE